MVIKSSSLHWGLIFPQGVLRSWTENVLQKKNNFCPAKQICPAAKRCNSSNFSTASWPTKTARIDARGKNVVLAHIKKQHILSQSGYVAPAELKFPWIISLCLGIQPPASPRLNVLLKFDGKISLGVLVMSCALCLSTCRANLLCKLDALMLFLKALEGWQDSLSLGSSWRDWSRDTDIFWFILASCAWCSPGLCPPLPTSLYTSSLRPKDGNL